MMIFTLIGELPEENLRKVVEKEETPQGWSVTTKYFYGDLLVRQDCNIAIKELPRLECKPGKV